MLEVTVITLHVTENPKIITRNPSHIASRISHVNQTELKKWLPDAIKKCMGSKIKSQFLPV